MSDVLKQLVEKHSDEVKVATVHDKVYKDECVYSYDTPESPNGLFVCLKSFIGVSKEFLPLHFQKTGSHIYLRIKTWRKQKEKIEDDEELTGEPEKKKPSKLALGISGGFSLDEKQFYFEHEYFIYVHPDDKELKLAEENILNDLNLTDKVKKSALSVIKAESAAFKEELASQTTSWDGEKRFTSKHSSNLQQLPDRIPISPDPSSWKCERCDVDKNLWLNLTDGKILCGRRQMDGSGGNNHAVEHYQKTSYPLAVKLGTITAQGADVYSYDEDDMVEDANLAIHLAHFGINMSKMEKTDKTMAELEIDLNQKVGEWDRIQEAGSQLVELFGPGYTGMRNLGNSCYMNSVMQVLFTLPDFIEKYVNNRDEYFRMALADPSNDFNFQMTKLGYGLLSGKYSTPLEQLDSNSSLIPKPKGIKPTSFKSLIGRGHIEFSTKRQQDSHEFLIYLLTLIERNLRNDRSNKKLNPTDAFRFKQEDRIQCTQSKQVKYKFRDEFCLSLPVAKDCALNKEQVKEFEERKANLTSQGLKLEPGDLVRPEIRLTDCIEIFKQEELISNFYSSAVKSQVNALKTTRLATFPPFLLIQSKKFEHAADWSPIKLNVSLQVPDELDLSNLRGSGGLREGEFELKDEENSSGTEAKPANLELNEEIVSQLVDMGFSLDGSKRAVFNTRESNDTESAVNWAVAHMEDADFNSPFTLPTQQQNQKTNDANINKNQSSNNATKLYNEESINSIISWGFTRQQAMKALDATDNNIERAADWIFSHANDLMDLDNDNQPSSSSNSNAAQNNEQENYRDYPNGRYKLVAFISHMGYNANVGHYVAHILKDEKWTIFNDENVALSENPPKDLAYLYIYKAI